jgi:predicted ATPase
VNDKRPLSAAHWHFAIATGYRGWAMARTGAAEAGTAQIGSAIGIWRAMGSDVALPAFLSILAEAQIANGHATAAMETTDEALARSPAMASDNGRVWFAASGATFSTSQGMLFGLRRSTRDRSLHRPSAGRSCLGTARSTRLGQAVARTGQAGRDAPPLLASAYGSFAESAGLPDLIEARKLIEELAVGT